MVVVRRALLCLSLLFVVAGLATGQEKGDKKKKGPQTPPAVLQIEKQLAGLSLNDEQKTKVQAIVKEHAEKIRAAQQKTAEILTKEQIKERGDAARKAKSEGKKGKELAEAVAAASKVSPEQQAKLDEANKAVRDSVAAMRKAVIESLPAELKDKLDGTAPKKKKNK